MIRLLAILAALQLSVISSPYDPKNDLEGAARIQKTREDILQGRDVMASASSPTHPVVVDDKEVSASGHGLGPIDIRPNSFPSGGGGLPPMAPVTRFERRPPRIRHPGPVPG
jgi:hypothetical protein